MEIVPRDRLQQLRENESDLQTELNDLASEIDERCSRVVVVRDLLRETRREIARLVSDDPEFREFVECVRATFGDEVADEARRQHDVERRA